MKKFPLLIALTTIIISCGENNNAPKQAETLANTTTSTSEEIILSSDDNMRFDKKEIKLKEGQQVKLTLKHTGKMPKSAMGHNFVLLKNDVDFAALTAILAQATPPEYHFPEAARKDVIVYSDMIGGGESTSVTFTAPAKGIYRFICSFPGHYAMMQGTVIVE